LEWNVTPSSRPSAIATRAAIASGAGARPVNAATEVSRAPDRPHGTMSAKASASIARLSAKPWIATRRCTLTPKAQILAPSTHNPGVSRRQSASTPRLDSTAMRARAMAVM
jgi:hypothetical protein